MKPNINPMNHERETHLALEGHDIAHDVHAHGGNRWRFFLGYRGACGVGDIRN